MEVKVTVTHELGEETKKFIASLLGGVAAAPATKAPAAKPAAASKENTDEEAEEEKPATRAKRGAAKPATKAKDEEVEEAEEDEAPKGRARRSTASKAKEEEDEAPATKTRSRKPAAKAEDEAPVFADMSDEEKLDEIKAKITLTTKKKGGADDVRELLGVFDAGRAGELSPKDYDEFYDALTRYRAGESVDEIFPEVD